MKNCKQSADDQNGKYKQSAAYLTSSGIYQDLVFNWPLSLLSLLSRSASCLRNPSFGRTSRCRRTSVKASTAVMFCLNIKQAKTHVLDRDMPIRQLTRTFPEKKKDCKQSAAKCKQMDGRCLFYWSVLLLKWLPNSPN